MTNSISKDLLQPPEGLRDDLQALIKYTQQPDLAGALSSLNVKTVLEVGPGYNAHVLGQIHQAFAKLGQPTRNHLFSVDPEHPLRDIFGVILKEYQADPNDITIIENNLEDVTATLGSQFDLVISRGVITAGAGMFTKQDPEAGRKQGFSLLKATHQCLNPDNPNSDAIFSTKTPGNLLPFLQSELEGIGLKTVFFKKADTEDAQDWIEILQEDGIFPNGTQEKFFSLVVCQRK